MKLLILTIFATIALPLAANATCEHFNKLVSVLEQANTLESQINRLLDRGQLQPTKYAQQMLSLDKMKKLALDKIKDAAEACE